MNGYGIAVAEKKESFKLGIVIIKEMEMARFIWELNISGKRSYCCLPPRKIMAVSSSRENLQKIQYFMPYWCTSAPPASQIVGEDV